jgi:hypothetical protein
MGSVFGGGGGGGGPAPDTTTQFIREAPGIEERKLELMDLARQTAKNPISIPDIQVQGLSPLEQAAITQAGQTGIGAGTVQQGIGSIQGAQQTAALDPTSTQFQNYFNPYQSFITDEINRQAQMQQNQIANEAVMGGAFGGGREGVQRAELGGRTLSAIGQAQGNAFQNALNAFQQNQALQTQAGLQGGVQLGTLGQLQQEMAGTDIARQLTAGGLERQLGQAELDAYRQTQLQRSAEPLQRLEFLSNIYAAGPKSTSGITAATLPQSSPLAQSIGTGLGVAQAYQGMQNPAKFNEGGIVNALKVKKYQTGGSVSDDDDESADLLNDEYTGSVPQYISPEQRRNLMLRPLTSQLLQATRRPGQSEASAVAGALGRGLEGQQDTALQLTKYDAAVKAAQEKAKGSKADLPTAFGAITGAQLGTGDPDDEYFGEVDAYGRVVGQPQKTYDSSEEAGKIRKAFDDKKISKTDSALRDLESYIQKLASEGKGGDLPGVGFFGGRSPITSTEGRTLRAKLATFQNIVLKERSGAAVTENELLRIVNELAGGETTKNEKAFLIALHGARNALEKEKLEVINSFGDQKAINKYLENEGIGLYDSPTFIQGIAKQAGAFMPIEGRNILEVDGKQVTFIGGVRFVYDSKKGKFYPVKDKKKK